ncbi:hypothetical protein GCM10009837_32360 [Streptomyces durmitorensis]|uniref:Uncharacterized protein n=1 Tax=Streptomyces durmitorensis TaxID=319947 RepID=A0ABY4PZL3_9ACTN|nr:hypothetical protein [Streptomyces durmitorensis]UQT59355.1 hypothetical protein M4V62_32205 [Streptomyces durmitorensis]
MPAALREWWHGVLTAIGQAPWRSGGSGGAQGAGGASTGSASDATGSASPGQTPDDGPTYNQLVREAMANQGRTDRMDTLDRHRTDDNLRMFTTRIVYCTGCILVLVLTLTGVLVVLGTVGMTGFWTVGSVIAVFSAPVIALSRQLTHLISQTGATPTLSDDRRAVVPAQRPEPRAEADDPA